MEETRKNMLDNINKIRESNDPATRSSYVIENRKNETNFLTVGGSTIRTTNIDYSKERDGIKLPHVFREIKCTPAADV